MKQSAAARNLSNPGKFALVLLFCLAILPVQAAANAIEAITFDVEKGQLYVPLEDAVRELEWKVERYSKTVFVGPEKMKFAAAAMRRLLDNTELVSVAELQKAGAELVITAEGGPVTVQHGSLSFDVVKAAKRVEVDLTKQQLSAWEGSRLVLQTHISSGRYRNSTPMGEFTAGPYKAEMHFSKKYNHAPMPWSVQLNDHVFIHGFSSVPRYPASHGCIRVPLDKGNPAKFFYEWVAVGTVVRVVRS